MRYGGGMSIEKSWIPPLDVEDESPFDDEDYEDEEGEEFFHGRNGEVPED